MIQQHTHDELASAKSYAYRTLSRLEALDYDGTGNPDLDARIHDLVDHASDLAKQLDRACEAIGGGRDAR
jgi:hypothetical protein